VLDCAPPPPPPLPTVVTTCVDDSTAVTGGSEAATETADGAGGSRQTELDHILDEIVRDIDLLDQTLADNCGQSVARSRFVDLPQGWITQSREHVIIHAVFCSNYIKLLQSW